MDDKRRLYDGQQARLVGLWERLVRMLGVYTVNVLLDRAIWQAAQQYPELAGIRYSDTGLSFDDLPRDSTTLDNAAFDTLYDEMLLILARLLGRDMARRLIDDYVPGGASDASDVIQEG